MKSKRIVIIIIAILLLISCIVVPFVVLTGDNAVTITFEANGGCEIKPITIKRGDKLINEPITSKQGCVFDGWFVNDELSERFYKNEVINDDLKLYASFIERHEENVKVDESKEVFLDDVSSEYVLSINSSIPLTSNNLSRFIEFTPDSGKKVNLVLTKNTYGYDITPETPYTAGGLYNFVILNERISFVDQPKVVTSLAIRIHKDKVEKMDLVNGGFKSVGMHQITSDLVLDDGYDYPQDSTYIRIPKKVCDKKQIKPGDTILLYQESEITETEDPTPGPGSLFVNIISMIEQGDEYFITTSESTLDDIIESVDISLDEYIDLSEEVNTETLDNIVKTLYNSEGTRKLTTLFTAAIITSPTVQKLGDGTPLYDPEDPLMELGFSDNAKKEHGATFAIESMLDGLTIEAFLGKASNSNFDSIKPNEWSALEITFKYETTLKNKVNIEVEISMTQYIHATLQGYKEGHGINIDFDFALNLYTQTDMNFTVLISVGESEDDEEEKEDISVEIGAMIAGSEEDDENLIKKVKELLDNKGDEYIKLCDVELVNKSFPLLPKYSVFQFNCKINFVMKFLFAAGIQTNLSFLEASQVGMNGSTKNLNLLDIDLKDLDIHLYKHELLGNNRFSIDIYACGYLGIKIGFNSKLTLSFYGIFRAIGEIGVRVEIGAFIDIYAYVHFYLAKLEQYNDYITMSITGGVYFEIGIYFEFGLIAESRGLFEAELGLLDEKIPLATIGEEWLMVDLVGNKEECFLHTDTININSLNLLTGKFMSLKTGEEKNKPVNPEKLHIWFSNRYLKYDQKTQLITVNKDEIGKYSMLDGVAKGDLVFDTTMTVVYEGQMLSFNNISLYGNGITTVGEIKIKWVDPSIDIKTIDDLEEVYTATIQYNCDGVITPIATRQVKKGKSIGEFDISAALRTNRISTGWDTDPNNYALTEDKTFTLFVEKIKAKVGFMWFDGTKWVSEVWGVRLGDTPVSPAGSENSCGDELNFIGWKGIKCINGNNKALPQTFSGIQVMPENIFYYGYPEGMMLPVGTDISKPIQTASGSDDDAMKILTGDFYYQGVCYYVAQYECKQYPVTIEVIDNNDEPVIREYVLNYGDNANNYNVSNLNQCKEIIGWDFNNDGIPDYEKASEFPIVTGPQTIKAIFRQRKTDLVIFDIYNVKHIEKGDAYQLVDLTTFEEIKNPTRPEDENIVFKNYEYSYDNKTYFELKEYLLKNFYLRDGMYIRPIYSYNAQISILVNGFSQIAVNQLSQTDFTPNDYCKNPIRKSDAFYSYVHVGWKVTGYFINSGIYYEQSTENIPIDGSFKVNDIINIADNYCNYYRIDALFESIDVMYTLRVKAEKGNVPGYDKEFVTFENLKYWDMRELQDKFIEEVLDDVYEGIHKYTCYFVDNYFDDQTHTSDVIYRFKQEVIQYTLTFDALDGTFKDGSSQKDITNVTTGTEYTFTNTEKPVKTSIDKLYEFVDWVDDKGIHYNSDSKLTITSDMTFTANYQETGERIYSVVFKTERSKFNNDEMIVTIEGVYNSNIELPALPLEYDDVDGYHYIAVGYDQSIEKISENTQVNVIWERTPRKFTITYYLEGKPYGEIQTVDFGTLISELAEPTSDDNKSFTGWIWTSDKANYPGIPNTMPAENLYANGEFTTYYVTYQDQYSILKKDSHKAGSVIPILDIYQEDGYTFTEWILENDLVIDNNTFTMPKGNVVFNTVRTTKSYNITYLLDGNNYGEVKTAEYLSNVKVENSPEPKVGHTFSLWACDDISIVNNGFKMPCKDIVIKGTYNKNSYNVIYKVDGIEVSKETHQYQEMVQIKKNPVKEGYIFSEWKLPDDVILTEGTFIVDKEIIIEGKFTKGEYTITLIRDDQTEPISISKADYTDEVDLSKILINLPNHLMVDYWVSEDVEITNNLFIMPMKDIIIKCITKYKTFKVIYLESEDGELVQEVNVTYNQETTVDTLPCVRRGKVLSTWKYSSGLTEELTTNEFTMPANDVIFVGEWLDYLTIDDGTNYDKYDTENSQFSGYSYDATNKVLEIFEPNLTISGVVSNVVILINTTSVTLSNLTINSNEDGYYYTEYRYSFDYYGCDHDACILINTINAETIVNIEGTVEINKDDTSPYDFIDNTAIATINSEMSIYPDEEKETMFTDDKVIIKGLGQDKSVLRTNESKAGIISYVSLEISDLLLDINYTEAGIIGGNILFSSCEVLIKTNNNDKNAITADMPSYALTNFSNCTLDIVGNIDSDFFKFVENTNGTIKSLSTCIRSENNMHFALNPDCQIHFIKSLTNDNHSVIELSNKDLITFGENNQYLTDKIVAYTQCQVESYHEFVCLGENTNDKFIILNEIIIGNVIKK